MFHFEIFFLKHETFLLKLLLKVFSPSFNEAMKALILNTKVHEQDN